MRANASKRRQTRTNASKRRGANASKRKQTRANVDKRKQTLTPPFIAVFYTPLCNPMLTPRFPAGACRNDFWTCFKQKNPRAHKNKISTSPAPQSKITPPLKRGILWTWRFCCRKNTEILGAHKIGAAISGPRIADKNFTDTRMFLI